MDSTEQSMTQSIRRHDIDWLRVILFGLLVPFHIAIGVYWTTYGDHINPNITDDAKVDSAIDEERNPYTGESVDPMSLTYHDFWKRNPGAHGFRHVDHRFCKRNSHQINRGRFCIDQVIIPPILFF